MLTGFKRKFRVIIQRVVLLGSICGLLIYLYSYVDLEFCYKIMSQNSLTFMCKKYKNNEYSGTLCEELCLQRDFKNFKCPHNEMKTIIFTAHKNGDNYAVKLAKDIDDDLRWKNSKNELVFPKIEDFHRIVKLHITLTYNVSLDDSMIGALVNQEIDKKYPEQMWSFWRLYKDNNYMLGKLYDEESVFPTVLSSCGPYYATEHLQILMADQSFMQYIFFDWQRRLTFALDIMEYIFRLEDMKPEPLKMCEMNINLFGLTADKRLKYQNAEFVMVESQLDKKLANGKQCKQNSDCNWHYCMGKCDEELSVCTGVQQNSNFQIYCEQILKGGGLFPGLLATSKTPKSLMALLHNCIDPSKKGHFYARPYAPGTEIVLRLYNELKRLYKEFPKQKGN
ncbi:divergent protein kinase domain 1C [Teleopsis dalmanni]|uniref:divergent protein kinase domain 1C n=1 Tax=Teleopsis dalmanni TaxID=139649 RepID=UPI0018CDDD8E|nr:divergent protein kinase domain 1C [Teleopsis dalmanni]